MAYVERSTMVRLLMIAYQRDRRKYGAWLSQYISRSMIRWYRGGANLGGVYLFTAEVSEKVMAEYITPKCLYHEGILDWKSIDWLLNPNNTGVVDNVQIIL